MFMYCFEYTGQMRKIVVTVIAFYAYCCSAQHYQCLQSGVKHYFINGNGYLRGIMIDSVRASSGSVVYYPFHTPRGAYSPTPYTRVILETNGGSWLGKRVQQLTDGTFVFDSYWGGSVIIKTQAALGDTWVFYQDSGSLYYKAAVVGIDTMSLLSSLDSVKRIMINAYNGSGPVHSDPLDSFVISLSKGNGFAEVFDLYTFPYHKPDSAYRLGLDFYLDRSTCAPFNINTDVGLPVVPSRVGALFKLVDFVNPNEQQLYNWGVGDVIESNNITGIPIYSSQIFTYLTDTITSKVISGHIANYTVSGSSFSCPVWYPCSLICRAGGYSFSDLVYPIIDTSLMPESSHYHGDYIFYYPNDISHCSVAPHYTKVVKSYNPGGLGWVLESTSYKLGIGKTEFNHADGEPVYEFDNLLYYSIHGTACGTPLLVEDFSTAANSVAFSPNPASSELRITSTGAIYQIVIINPLGEVVYNCEDCAQNALINVSSFPAGLYMVKINGQLAGKFVKG